jgi:rhodanese-related sulfurtransferase
VAQTLFDKGFHDVFALRGGLDAWKRAGLPLAHKPQTPAASPD